MRLSPHYQQIIKKYFFAFFGSRADDTKKGGDIDLYLVIQDHTDLFQKKIKFLSKIKRELGDQKIDIVFNTDNTRLIEKEAQQWGIKL